jgi:hypothetical protein
MAEQALQQPPMWVENDVEFAIFPGKPGVERWCEP